MLCSTGRVPIAGKGGRYASAGTRSRMKGAKHDPLSRVLPQTDARAGSTRPARTPTLASVPILRLDVGAREARGPTLARSRRKHDEPERVTMSAASLTTFVIRPPHVGVAMLGLLALGAAMGWALTYREPVRCKVSRPLLRQEPIRALGVIQL